VKKTAVILLALFVSLLALTSTALADRGGIVDFGVAQRGIRITR